MSSPAKPRSLHATVVVTANRLRDGRVVWLADDGGWSERIAEARLFEPADDAAALELGRAAERARLVVGAYLVEVTQRGGAVQPLKFREKLRVRGPSVAAEPAAMLPLAS